MLRRWSAAQRLHLRQHPPRHRHPRRLRSRPAPRPARRTIPRPTGGCPGSSEASTGPSRRSTAWASCCSVHVRCSASLSGTTSASSSPACAPPCWATTSPTNSPLPAHSPARPRDERRPVPCASGMAPPGSRSEHRPATEGPQPARRAAHRQDGIHAGHAAVGRLDERPHPVRRGVRALLPGTRRADAESCRYRPHALAGSGCAPRTHRRPRALARRGVRSRPWREGRPSLTSQHAPRKALTPRRHQCRPLAPLLPRRSADTKVRATRLCISTGSSAATSLMPVRHQYDPQASRSTELGHPNGYGDLRDSATCVGGFSGRSPPGAQEQRTGGPDTQLVIPHQLASAAC